MGMVAGPPTRSLVNLPPQTLSVPFSPISLPSGADISGSYSGGSSAGESFSVSLTHLFLQAPLGKDYVMAGVGFEQAGDRYIMGTEDSNLVKNPSAATGVGTVVGAVTPTLGRVQIDTWPAGGSSLVSNWRAIQGPPVDGITTPFLASTITFRTATAPLRVGSMSVQGTMADGTNFNVTSNNAGRFNGTRVKGQVDFETGVAELFFVNPAGDVLSETADLSYLEISGVGTVKLSPVRTNSLKYSATAFSYIPLDADLIGVDPVRLPSDGRVPIFRQGSIIVVHNTQTHGPITVSNGQTVSVGRTRLKRMVLRGNNGAKITTGFTRDLDAGTMTFTSVAGYSQPVSIEHMIADKRLVREMQIEGSLVVTRGLSHNYPVPGSYVSSAMVVGDRHARVPLLFDQQSWTNVWSDDLIGNQANATYDQINFPVVVTNRGAATERFYVVFRTTTSIEVFGEHLGLVYSGPITSDVVPLNPANGQPLFRMPKEGFAGGGWAIGNVVRINVVGSGFPIWMARVTAQGDATVDNDSFEMMVDGNVDRP